jgi:ferredoxin-type protein NapH
MKRKISLLISALLLHSSWGPEFKWLCNPVLSCHSCALAWFACPIGVFVHYSGYHLFPFIAFGTVMLVGVLVGRLLCGWVCPFGLVQDWLHKIPSRKIVLPGWTSNIKYVVLLLMVFLFPFMLGESTWLSFCRICPAAALQVSIPGVITGGFSSISLATAIRFAVLGVVVLLVIFSSRAFCNVLCPIGALLAPLNFVSFWVVKPPRESCLACQKCDKACSTHVRPSLRLSNQIPANRALDCIVCHDCQTACESTLPQAGPRVAVTAVGGTK